MTATLAPAPAQAAPQLPRWTVDWQAFAELRQLGLTVRIVEPVDLRPCAICPDTGLPALPSAAVLVYRTRAGAVIRREPVDTGCAGHLVEELRRGGYAILAVELPAVSA